MTSGRFAGPDDDVDVAVLVVTFNSAREIGELIRSLRAETADVSVRLVIADNSSSDATLALVRAEGDVIAVETGANLGYSGGINAAREHAGAARAFLVLNPDLRVERGALLAMLQRLASSPRIGIVAPRILDDEGRTAMSLNNEPRVFRALMDALLGRMWTARPPAFSEWVRDPVQYRTAHRIDWATGAALLIDADAAAAVGEWDERFFLYSEETDYCRRTRDRDFEVWFEPSATVHHSQGKSGASAMLDALMAVNRVRYVRKHAPRHATAYRWVALVGALLRSPGSDSQRLTTAMLRDESRWPDLPRAS